MKVYKILLALFLIGDIFLASLAAIGSTGSLDQTSVSTGLISFSGPFPSGSFLVLIFSTIIAFLTRKVYNFYFN